MGILLVRPHKVIHKVIPTILATSDVRYWVNQHAAVLPGKPTWKKRRLNWKMKISKTADNADITQSQKRTNTRHRRMQEIGSLFTDSGVLPAEYCIVGIPHNRAI